MDGRYDNIVITNEIKDLFFELDKYIMRVTSFMPFLEVETFKTRFFKE